MRTLLRVRTSAILRSGQPWRMPPLDPLHDFELHFDMLYITLGFCTSCARKTVKECGGFRGPSRFLTRAIASKFSKRARLGSGNASNCHQKIQNAYLYAAIKAPKVRPARVPDSPSAETTGLEVACRLGPGHSARLILLTLRERDHAKACWNRHTSSTETLPPHNTRTT